MAKYRPRLTIELTPQAKRQIDDLLSWGQKRKVYGAITDSIIRISQNPEKWQKFMGKILTNSVNLNELA